MLVTKKRFITTGHSSNPGIKVLTNSAAIQIFIEGLSTGFHIIGDKAFRSIPQIEISYQEIIDEESNNNFGIQRIIV